MRRRRFLLLLAGVAGGAMAAPAEFAPVLPGRKLVFPADHGAHPQFRSEWWYATGWLALPDGSPLGFQTTFFRVRTGLAEESASAFAPRQLILAHAAIADPRVGHLLRADRVARVAPGSAGYAQDRTFAWASDWRFEQQEDHYVAAITGKDFSYALTLVPPGPPLLNGIGGDGFSQKAIDPRNASYYYSRPQLAVSGTVTLGGRRQAVSGRAWLDHEWSSELLPTNAQGWDWVGLNLYDGDALMAFRLRDGAGKPIWAAGTYAPKQGAARRLRPQEVVFEPVRVWQSARTNIRYPVAWVLRVPGRELHLAPLMDDQELDGMRSTGTVYWEGAVRVREAGREIGRGYLELTGYGEKIRVG